MKGLKRVEQGCNKINILLQQWELQRLEIFFLFVAIVFIPLHFLVQIDVPIYGDGAVYANLGRYVAEGHFYPLQFRTYCEGIFADHPYLFFYFLGFFYKIFSFQEIALKIPNFIFGLLTVFILYRFLQEKGQYKNRLGSLVAVFASDFRQIIRYMCEDPFWMFPLFFSPFFQYIFYSRENIIFFPGFL